MKFDEINRREPYNVIVHGRQFKGYILMDCVNWGNRRTLPFMLQRAGNVGYEVIFQMVRPRDIVEPWSKVEEREEERNQRQRAYELKRQQEREKREDRWNKIRPYLARFAEESDLKRLQKKAIEDDYWGHVSIGPFVIGTRETFDDLTDVLLASPELMGRTMALIVPLMAAVEGLRETRRIENEQKNQAA